MLSDPQERHLVFTTSIPAPPRETSNRREYLKSIIANLILGLLAAAWAVSAYAIIAPIVHRSYEISLPAVIEIPLITFIGGASGILSYLLIRGSPPSPNSS